MRARALPVSSMFPMLGALLGCTDPGATEAPSPPSVIVIVLDGVRTDEFTSTTRSDVTGTTGEAFAAETWATVAPDATVVRAARNDGVTITAPAHLALVTGQVEAFANFPVDRAIGPGLYRPTLPTLFEAARDQLGLRAEEVLLLSNTELLAPLDRSLYPGAGRGAAADEVTDPETGLPVGEDGPVLEALLRRVETLPPRLAVVNLHDVDRAGHYGEPEDYAEGVVDVDEQLATFWEGVQKARPAYAESLLLVVIADHGRHRHDDDSGWRNHGDACTGCREVPLFVVGGGVDAGRVLDETVSLVDLAPALAAHLGVTLPWAEGLPSPALFPGFDQSARSGEVSVAADGALVATQGWLDDPEQRSEVRVGVGGEAGTTVSTAGVYAAEAPTVLDGATGGRVCFRELALEPVDGMLPWVARCLARTGDTWADMGFPDAEVAPFFAAALAERDGVTWAAWPANPRGGGEAGVDGRVGLAVAGWTEGVGWSDPVLAGAIFPTDAAIVATDTGLVAAFGTSFGDPDSRYTRHVRVVPVAITDGAAALGEETNLTLVGLLGEGARVERPALTRDGGVVRVAMLGITEAGVTVAASSSEDGGVTWSGAVALPEGGLPFPHLAPAWDSAEVVWGTLVGEEARLCRAAPGAAEARCVEVGSARLQRFVVADGVAIVVRDAGVGAWETATLSW